MILNSGNRKSLIIGYVWPERTSSAAGVRTWNVVRLLKSIGYEVYFSSPSKTSSFRDELETVGVKTVQFEANDSAFNQYVSELDPHLVIFDRFVIEEQFGWRVREACPKALRVIDTQDLHFLRRARERALKSGGELDLMTDDTFREVAAIYRSDMSLILSDYEYDLLLGLGIPRNKLFVLRFCYDFQESGLSFGERLNFSWIGNFRHPPNADSVFQLVREIWPEIRKLIPQAELHVFGAYPPKEVSELNQPSSGVYVRGWVPEACVALENFRVSLAPLRFGAGIKGKIADSWAAGTPVVTTAIGAEGMAGELPFGGSVTNSYAEFISEAVSFYHDGVKWSDAQRTGYQVLRERFSFDGQRAVLLDAISRIDRKNDLIGSMLWYHQLRSTEYFSRWIELKNSKEEGSR